MTVGITAGVIISLIVGAFNQIGSADVEQKTLDLYKNLSQLM
jgi:hypothetical protein